MTLYHTGFLALDREFDPALHKMARKLWKRAMRGEIHLIQQRSEKYKWRYYYMETAA